MDAFPRPRDEVFTSCEVCRLVGCTYRMLDYWSRTGAVRPAFDARGSGTRRLWTTRQARCVWVVARLAEMGCPTPTLAAVFDALEADGSLWDGPLLVESGRGGMVRPVRALDDLDAGWVVDPRAALDAVVAERTVAA